jgi:hypothetical protein
MDVVHVPTNTQITPSLRKNHQRRHNLLITNHLLCVHQAGQGTLPSPSNPRAPSHQRKTEVQPLGSATLVCYSTNHPISPTNHPILPAFGTLRAIVLLGGLSSCDRLRRRSRDLPIAHKYSNVQQQRAQHTMSSQQCWQQASGNQGGQTPGFAHRT